MMKNCKQNKDITTFFDEETKTIYFYCKNDFTEDEIKKKIVSFEKGIKN